MAALVSTGLALASCTSNDTAVGGNPDAGGSPPDASAEDAARAGDAARAEDAGEDSSVLDASPDVDAGPVTNVPQVSVGTSGKICFRHATGHVSCLGPDPACDAGPSCKKIPIEVAGITNAAEVQAGKTHVCARLSTGHVMCWGEGIHGELGDGQGISSNTPVEVSGISDANQLSVGAYTSCVRRAGGAVWCWGNNAFQQIGPPNGIGFFVSPVAVSGMTNATFVSVAGRFTCAILQGGQVVCQGGNRYTTLGDGLISGHNGNCGAVGPGDATGPGDCSRTAVNVSGATNAKLLSVGDKSACIVRTNGKVSCWGLNHKGQLGDGVVDHGNATPDCSFPFSGQELDCQPTPVDVVGLSNPTSLVVGEAHACAVRAGGQLTCWGDDSAGQLGMGKTGPSNVPQDVTTLTNAAALSTNAANATCALAGGKVLCWSLDATYRPAIVPF